MEHVRPSKTLSEKYHDIMPSGAGALFLIQIFSTLSFSVLYSTLILYATKGLHMSDVLATSITGSFIALNYFLHLLGGYIGGRFLTYRSLFALGMVLQVFGCLFIAVPNVSCLLWGLAVFLGGSGLNVTCINCMVTQLFEPHDKRREAAFLWNYSGMNIGFFIGFLTSGYFHLHQNYHQLFLLSALGNLVAFVLTMYNWRTLQDHHTPYIEAAAAKRAKLRWIGTGLVIALVFALRGLMDHTAFCNQLILVIGFAMLLLIMGLTFKQPGKDEQHKMWAYIILALSAVIFWTLYQLAPMGLNLFIERNVDRHIFGILIAPQWIQNINTIVIIIGGPLLSIVFTHFRERGRNISIPFQFACALLLSGLSLVILPIGISLANPQGQTSFYWVLLSYVLISTGELFISPIGYAMIGQLAPIHLRGLMMGIWMMITGVAAILSDHFSKIALGTTGSTDPLMTNSSYSYTFGSLGWAAIAAGVILYLLVPFITRLTREKKMDEFDNKQSLAEKLAA